MEGVSDASKKNAMGWSENGSDITAGWSAKTPDITAGWCHNWTTLLLWGGQFFHPPKFYRITPSILRKHKKKSLWGTRRKMSRVEGGPGSLAEIAAGWSGKPTSDTPHYLFKWNSPKNNLFLFVRSLKKKKYSLETTIIDDSDDDREVKVDI